MKHNWNEINYIEKEFPELRKKGYKPTSIATPDYNCIAWAAGKTDEWWWPGLPAWPKNAPGEIEIKSFQRAFEDLGYSPCEDALLEPGIEKVAVYAIGDEPTHMARQLENGKWTSKLGPLLDIDHETPDCLNGGGYGKPVLYMKRNRSQ